jgi:hypothetical protein
MSLQNPSPTLIARRDVCRHLVLLQRILKAFLIFGLSESKTLLVLQVISMIADTINCEYHETGVYLLKKK